MSIFLAHAADQHIESTTTLEHWVTTPSIYILILAVIVATIVVVLRFLNKSVLVQLLASSFILFLGGIFGYVSSPTIGAIAIGLGLVVSLVVVLIGLVGTAED